MKVFALALMVGMLAVAFVPPASSGHQYDQPVWFNWTKKNLDVTVAGVHDPLIGNAINRAIQMWQNGIAALGGPVLTIRVYWLDSGTTLPAGWSRDILVAPQGFMAVQPFLAYRCASFAPMAAGWGSFIRVTSHEFGHCLGLGHVFEHGVEYEPGFDIMGGGDGPKCPSNLNIQVLNRVFGGQGGTVSISSGAYTQAASC